MKSELRKAIERRIVRLANQAIRNGESLDGKVALAHRIAGDLVVALVPRDEFAAGVSELTMARLRKMASAPGAMSVVYLKNKAGECAIWTLVLKKDPSVEQVSEVNGERCLNTPGLLRMLYQLDLDDIGNPAMRPTIERFQARARSAIVAEPPESGRTIGQILHAAWGQCPAIEGGNHPPGACFSVDFQDVLAWLDRPLRSVG